MDIDLIILFVLIFLSAFFSGSEIALISLSEVKMRTMINEGHLSARLVSKLRKNPHRLLVTILVGNNFVNIGASVLCTVWATKHFGESFLAYITGILTLVILIFGEILPKTIAERFPRHFALFIARPLYLFQLLTYPAIWVLEKFMGMLLNLVKKHPDRVTEDEIKTLISMGTEEGLLESEEQEIIENVLEFSDMRVENIMTPRANIIAIDANLSIKEAVDIVLNSGFSRIPVYEDYFD
ncbi:MAG TPA: CNNM domain-containing protein, partial [Candidatus Gracilibacteria bacterium]|nr:CNNM domain-containing protein [Candidatus Gracilibacteria bacterium]